MLRLHAAAHGCDPLGHVRLIGYGSPMSNMSVQPADRSWTATKVVSVIVAIVTAGYMLPWAIAAVRDVPHWLVFWINLLLGWTIIGWIVALVMSLRMQRFVITD